MSAHPNGAKGERGTGDTGDSVHRGARDGTASAPETELATLAGGCFWCLEAVYRELRGVRGVKNGYAGGHLPNPSYEQVCSKKTGHAEVVQVEFDPEEISFGDLLDVLFTIHDPTTKDRQGNDVGPQYRSAIFTHSEVQARVARERLAAAQAHWSNPIVTEIAPLDRFWPAESDHDNYFARNPHNPYCAVVVAPKVAKARKRFVDMLARRMLAALLVLLPAAGIGAQPGVLRGIVTDTSGRPIANAEVLSINSKRSTRTARDGRFHLAKLPFGQQLIMVRLPGYQPADRAVNMLDTAAPELTFRLRPAVQAIDTVRIVSHDGCTAYDFGGFDCRRRAGIGQFRGPEELSALKPYYWADMFEALPGLRRTPVRDSIIGLDWRVESTTGWRCLMEGWNGRFKTAAEERIRPGDIVAIEHYDVYEKVPAAYRRLAWPNGQDKPCALIIYWTRGFVEQNSRR